MSKKIFGVIAAVVVAGLIGVAMAEDIAMQFGEYVMIFDVSDESNIFAYVGNDLTGYYIDPVEQESMINGRVSSVKFGRVEWVRTYSNIEPLTHDIKDYSTIRISVFEFDRAADLQSSVDNVTELFELSRDIRPAGYDGKIGLENNAYIACYPLDNSTMCHVMYTPLERNRPTAVNDLAAFVNSLEICKGQLRDLI